MKIAILLTVYNRKEITIKGLNSLYIVINKDPKNTYDVFMVNDGCTDGTEIEIAALFPKIHIISHEGNLYWSKGMNLAWKTAAQHDKYDYFIWYNDDAFLFDNAIEILFESLSKTNKNSIICGAFKGKNNQVSYGGRNKNNQLIEPNGKIQDIFLMNGNLVLIPFSVFNQIGFIDNHYQHGIGDCDYGLTAINKGINIFLSQEYVGITNRHDNDTSPYIDTKYPLFKRISFLYTPKYSVNLMFYFYRKHFGTLFACSYWIKTHLYTFFPFIYTIKEIIKHKYENPHIQ